MRFGVFAYNFPHWKTQQGLLGLSVCGFTPEVVICQDFKELNLPSSKLRTTPYSQLMYEVDGVCEALGLKYIVSDHNSMETVALIKELKLDFGIVLGARILPPSVIDAFGTGVINMHPGILPDNRGLDNVKWAIINNIPQGVTVHYVNEKVDAGWLIQRYPVPVRYDDSLVELRSRLLDAEISALLLTLGGFERNGVKPKKDCEVLSEDVTKFRTMPPGIEKELSIRFVEYKEVHGVTV